MFYCCNQECKKRKNNKEQCICCGKIYFRQKKGENRDALEYLKGVIEGLKEYDIIQ